MIYQSWRSTNRGDLPIVVIHDVANVLLDGYKHLAVVLAVVAVALADVGRVGYFLGKLFGFVAQGRCCRVLSSEHSAVVHETLFGLGISPEAESARIDLTFATFPVVVGFAAGYHPEIVVVVYGIGAGAPPCFDGRLCQDHRRVQIEGFRSLASSR